MPNLGPVEIELLLLLALPVIIVVIMVVVVTNRAGERRRAGHAPTGQQGGQPPGAIPSAPVLIATFGPSTAWQSKAITWQGGALILEGYGPISARDVINYDEAGHLVWASDASRAWLVSFA